MGFGYIEIRGAREHNLKNISLRIPLGGLTVVTGDSGSGKSSLAFDVLYVEARRKYVDAMSPDRSRIAAPAVEFVEPAPAAIALSQEFSNRNPQSTLATFTRIGEIIKGLVLLAGEVFCPICGVIMNLRSRDSVLKELLSLPPGAGIIIKAVISSGGTDDSHIKAKLERFARQGFLRCEIRGHVHYLEDLVEEGVDLSGSIRLIIDRIVSRKGVQERLADSLSQACSIEQGMVEVAIRPDGAAERRQAFSRTIRFSEEPACFMCGYSVKARSQKGFIASTGGNGPRMIRKISGLTVSEILALPIRELSSRLNGWEKRWSRSDRPELRAAGIACRRLLERLSVLGEFGLWYLPLDSSIPALSSGEVLKVRLASLLFQRLTGVLFVLDEPLSGLDEREREIIRKKILALKQAGNTIVVVEHDQVLMRKYADWILEIGPGAGASGGELVFQGTSNAYFNYLKGKTAEMGASGTDSTERGFTRQKDLLTVSFVPVKNLREECISIPVAAMTGVFGSTGSGKSALLAAVYEELSKKSPPRCRSGAAPGKGVNRVRFMDQRLPLGARTSLVATFSGIYRHIAALMARTPDARARGITAGYLSLSRKGGRCEKCKGTGRLVIDPEFLEPVEYVCDACHGRRFSADVLCLAYRGVGMADVLEMTVTEAATFFRNMAAIRKPLEALERTGLGYLQLGQSVGSLSGGERQRLKLAATLSGGSTIEFLILDNLSRGLSRRDLQSLLGLLSELVDSGHTVLVADNDEAVLERCECVLKMGPGGGPKGGKIIYQGPFKGYRHS